MTPWEFKGRELVNCNCVYACPCQFNALPDKGLCEALGAIAIEKGHHGNVRLDGLSLAVVMQWPGAIHEGKGKCQPIVDVRADAKQREALLKIMSGQDTEPFATMFAVFANTFTKVYDPIFTKIDFDVDIEGRRGKVRVKDVLELDAEPIRNPVTNKEHQVRIDLPHGFEYEIAEIGAGTSRSKGNIAIELKNSYAQFAHLHLNNKGPIRHRARA